MLRSGCGKVEWFIIIKGIKIVHTILSIHNTLARRIADVVRKGILPGNDMLM